jgi:hypothetical protein
MSNELPPVEESATTNRSRLLIRLFGLLLVVVAVVLGVYLFVAYFAWETGQTLRQEQAQTERTEQIAHQIELAQQDLNNDSLNLALRRLEWVLEQEPGNPTAVALQQQVQARRDATPVRPTAEASPAPTETPDPAEVVGATNETPQSPPLPELQRLRRLAEGEQWEELLPAVLAFQQQQPDYERTETDQLLFDSYIHLGLIYLETEKVELGLYYLSQAETLGNLPQEALDYRVWADLHLAGMSYYGVNWNIAASNFRELCLAAPFYQNSCQRLQEALINYGDQMAFAQDWCPAEVAYQEAWQRQRSEALGGKLAQAREGCLTATLTPSAPVSGTIPITGTFPISGTGAGE